MVSKSDHTALWGFVALVAIIVIFALIVFYNVGHAAQLPPVAPKAAIMTASLTLNSNTGELQGRMSNGTCVGINEGIVELYGGTYPVVGCNGVDAPITLWVNAQSETSALGFFYSKCYNGWFNLTKNPAPDSPVYVLVLTGQQWKGCEQ